MRPLRMLVIFLHILVFDHEKWLVAVETGHQHFLFEAPALAVLP